MFGKVCWVIPYYLWLEGLKPLFCIYLYVLLLEIVMVVVLSIVVFKAPVAVFQAVEPS